MYSSGVTSMLRVSGITRRRSVSGVTRRRRVSGVTRRRRVRNSRTLFQDSKQTRTVTITPVAAEHQRRRLIMAIFRLYLKYLLSKLEVCHPRCVCENWKGYVVKHNYVT